MINPFSAIVDNPGGPNLMFIKVPEFEVEQYVA